MTGFVVTEGNWDQRLVQLVMASYGIDSVRVVVGGGQSSATSLASSILASRHQPVVLVADADTVSERLLADLRQDLESLLKYSAPRDLWRLVLCKPELEVVFFDSGTVSIAEEVFGVSLDERQKAVALYDPNAILSELGGAEGWRERLISYLSTHPEACRRIGETSTLRPMVEFFRQHLEAAA